MTFIAVVPVITSLFLFVVEINGRSDFAPPKFPKRGLSGLSRKSCSDAQALGLANTWTYNWGVVPDGKPSGEVDCDPPQVKEFVPMIWGCWPPTASAPNCTFTVTPDVRDAWKRNGVTHLLGFNEPDNAGQSNLSPLQAATYWKELDLFASTFEPPLKLVGPGMTHWDETGGTPWLDQFLGNLSSSLQSNIVAFAQHDYSGDATGIIARAEALQKKYKKKVWLTEFSVGSGADRSHNDKFVKTILPLLDKSDAIERYAWYSTRNNPAAWVNQSSLLPPMHVSPGEWAKMSGHACLADEMLWLSQKGTKGSCQALAVDNAACTTPKTVIYQSGDVKNCYCANTSKCTPTQVSWQDLYVQTNGPVTGWQQQNGVACSENEMLWLSQHHSVAACQTLSLSTPGCTYTPTKEVFWEAGDVKNCYCSNSTTGPCKKLKSSWLASYTEPSEPAPSLKPTSTGILYGVL